MKRFVIVFSILLAVAFLFQGCTPFTNDDDYSTENSQTENVTTTTEQRVIQTSARVRLLSSIIINQIHKANQQGFVDLRKCD